MVEIPNDILEIARKNGVKSPEVLDWFKARIISAGGSIDASPADWPEDIWATYKALQELAAGGSSADSAKGLFSQLGIDEKD